MKKLFKEREIDKINNEILHEIYPVEALNKYFYLDLQVVWITLIAF